MTFTAGCQTTGFHVLGNMCTASRTCAVAFNSLRPLRAGRRSPIRRRCLRSLTNTAIWTTFVFTISHIYTAGWDNCRHTRRAKSLSYANCWQKRTREKGDRGANRSGSAPIMGGLVWQPLAYSTQNRILLPYAGV